MSEPRLDGYDFDCENCPHHSSEHHAGVTDAKGFYVTEEGKGPHYCLAEGCACTDLTLPPGGHGPEA